MPLIETGTIILDNDAQEIVEQDLVASLRHEAAQRAGGKRRKIDRLDLR